MVKHIVSLLMASVLFCAVFAEAAKIEFKHPVAKGTGEPVLVLSGGRPWTGAEFGDFLVAAGAKVLCLDSKHLAGEGGAPIRDMLGDEYEPTPADGITVEFAKLSQYKAVVVNNIPAKNQENIFTQERVALLKNYISQGGTLLLTIDAPASLGDLLPVEIVKENEKSHNNEVPMATRPATGAFAYLPETWKNFDKWYKVKAKPNATVLSQLKYADGSVATDYVVCMPYGKGRILYLNGTYTRYGKVAMLYSWAYGQAFIASLLQELASIPMKPESLIRKPAACTAPQYFYQVNVSIEQPKMELVSSGKSIAINGNKAVFGEGETLLVEPSTGTVSIQWVNSAKPYIQKMEPPKLLLITNQQKLDSDTSEAVDVKQKSTSSTVWKYEGMQSNGSLLTLNYSASNGAEMKWLFKTGALYLDGRTYNGFAQKAIITKAPTQISALKTSFLLDIDATFARRMNCYQPPRGYDEPDFSGNVDADTRPCQFFTNSQPFGYINTKDGIYAELLEDVMPTQIRFQRKKGEASIRSEAEQLIGRRNAPVEGQFLWHLYSNGTEHGHNDYIALWQFARHHLRHVTGLKEYPMRPTSGYTNTASPEERDKAIRETGKMNFSYYNLPLCPSSIDSLDSEQNMAIYKAIKDAGMASYPWSACDYTCGTGDWIYQNKKDWLMRDEKGGIYAYFSNHRVIDLENADFINWYFAKLKKIIDAGLGYIYLDMGGQAATNVNFAGGAESKPGLLNLVPIFHYFHKNDVVCGVEGMNPLVIDNYWYREKLYKPLAGKEFATIGTSLGTNAGDDFVLNYFRVAMYGAFPRIHTDAYVQEFERTPNEISAITHIIQLLPAIQKALDYGMPFVRSIPCGTTWVNENGGAIFCWDNVGKLQLSLPEGYELQYTQLPNDKMRAFKPSDLNNIPSETIFVFGKTK